MKLSPPRHLVHLLPSLLGLALFCLSIWAINQELKQYSIQEIWQSLRATPAANIGIAIGLTGLNYWVFTGYDTLAVRYVQHPTSYRQTAFVAIVSTAVSNSVGLALLSNSAIRYRFYSIWQFSPIEIVHIITFCNLGFWLGLSAVGGVVFTLQPVAIPPLLHLPFHSVRSLGGIFLAIVIGYFIWPLISRQALRIGRFEFPHLPVHLAIGQVGVAALDWTIAAATLDVLLPASMPDLTFFGIYLLGQIAGVVSNIPGGLGVFETVLLLLLMPSLPSTTVLSALIAYRMVYYLLPLLIAVVLLGKHELRQRLSHL